MFKSLSLLSLSVAVGRLVSLASAQTTNATCLATFNWVDNSRDQNPCLVAAYLMGACLDGQWNVVGITNTSLTYLGPSATQASLCTCSSVPFSLISACAYCQGAVLPLWSDWTFDCGTAEITDGQYAHVIPAGTAVPAWAYTAVITTWDPVQALQIHNQGVPESLAPGASTTSSSATSSSSTTASSSSASVSPTAPPPSPTATKKSSNAGAIAGGVVGGIAALAVIAALVFFFVIRKKKTDPSTAYGQGDYLAAEKYPPSLPTSPSPGVPTSPGTTGSPMKLYDPNDPSTFPSTPNTFATYDNAGAYNPVAPQPGFVQPGAQPYYPNSTPPPQQYGHPQNGAPMHPNLPQV